MFTAHTQFDTSLISTKAPPENDSSQIRLYSSPGRRRGCYVLILFVKRRLNFRAGALGVIQISRGAYAYVGSAMNNLDKRIGRYLRQQRQYHWHIDYLLEYASIKEIVVARSERSIECGVSRILLKQWPAVSRFGSSDCRCPGHLFGPGRLKKLRSSVYLAFNHCGVYPEPWRAAYGLELGHKT